MVSIPDETLLNPTVYKQQRLGFQRKWILLTRAIAICYAYKENMVKHVLYPRIALFH